jgi:hypothetical protein
MQDDKKVQLDMYVTPDEDGTTYTLRLEGVNLEGGEAQHLAQHISDAINDYMHCIGAVGVAKKIVKDLETGEEVEVSAETFGGTDYPQLLN